MESLNKYFREITRAAFARHGFAQAEIITNWGDIVGSTTWPRFPRRNGSSGRGARARKPRNRGARW
jgi:hypothetical protein